MIDIIALQQELQINGWRYDGADTAENALQSAISLSSPLIPQQGGEQTGLTVRHAFENIRNNYVGWQGDQNFEVLSAALFSDGMPVTQEPKYGIRDNRLFNRASGEFIPVEEPVFIFRARDVFAARRIHEYSLCCDGDHRIAVQQRADDFSKFAAAYPERMKTPDTVLSSAAVLPQVGGRPKFELTEEMRTALDASNNAGKAYAILPDGALMTINRGEQPEDTSDLDCPHCHGSGHKDDVKAASLSDSNESGPQVGEATSGAIIKRAVDRLNEILWRDGGPKWIEAKAVLANDLCLVLDGLCKSETLAGAAPAGLGEAKAVGEIMKVNEIVFAELYDPSSALVGSLIYAAPVAKALPEHEFCDLFETDNSGPSPDVLLNLVAEKLEQGESRPDLANEVRALANQLRSAPEALPVAAEAMPETTREMALNVILWFYRRAKPKYGQLKFADDAIALLRTADGLQGEKA